MVHANVEISLLKGQLAKQDTLQATIDILTDPLIDLSAQNFYVDNIKIPTILTKLSDSKYFAYSYTNLASGTHTLQIRLLYVENNILEERVFEQEFMVLETITKEITLDPALVIIKQEDVNPYFKIYLNNKGADVINLDINSQEEFIYPSKNSISIPPNEQRYFFLYTSSSKEKTDTIIELTSQDEQYFIPVMIIQEDQPITENKTAIVEINNKTTIITVENETAKIEVEDEVQTISLEEESATISSDEEEIIKVENKTDLRSMNLTELIKDKIKFNTTIKSFITTIHQNQTPEIFIDYYNSFENPIRNVTFELTSNLGEIISFKPESTEVIYPSSPEQLYIVVNSDKNAEIKQYEGNLLIKTGDITQDTFYILIDVVSSEEEVKENKRQQTIAFGDLVESENPLDSNPLFNYSKSVAESTVTKKSSKNRTFLIVVGVLVGVIIIAYFVINRPKKKSFKEYIKE